MTAAKRFLVVGLCVAALESALGIAALPTGLSPFLFACAATTATLAFVVRRLLVPPRDEPGDGGGGTRRPPDDPPPPPWWPEFEDAFRAHVRARERAGERVHG
jgi:hypothetical protein